VKVFRSKFKASGVANGGAEKAGKTAFSGIHTSCVKVFRSKFKASGVANGGGSPPPNFLI